MPEKFKNIQGWFDFDDVYNMFVEKINNGIIVEIGCWMGKSTLYLGELIREKSKNIQVYAIDTWEGSDEEAHKLTIANLGGPDKLYEAFKQNISEYSDIIKLIRDDSFYSSFDFNYYSVDAVYIDADHRYEYVKRDIKTWLPLVKVGGYIGGHDYNRNSCMDVARAVDEIFGDKISVHRNSWLYKKEKA